MTVDTLAHEILNNGVMEMQQEEEKLMATSTTIFTVEDADIIDKKENGTVMVGSNVRSMDEYDNLNFEVRKKEISLSKRET